MRALVWHGDDRLEVESLPEPAARRRRGPARGRAGRDLRLRPPRLPRPSRPSTSRRSSSATKRWGASRAAKGGSSSSRWSSAERCRACRRGEENLCEQRGLLGLDRQGVFAERVPVRADALVPVPDGLDPQVAVLVEPLATSLSALRLDGVEAGHDRPRRRRRPDRASRRVRGRRAGSPRHLRRAG